LEDLTPVGSQLPGAEIEFPLTLHSQDAKGNLSKMRLQGVDDATGRLSSGFLFSDRLVSYVLLADRQWS
jgi:hypothetical protein